MRDEATGLPLLLLPQGFEYISYGWTGDPMADGAPTPSAHDGMAAFRRGRAVHLVRNHERGNGTPFADPAAVVRPDRGGWHHQPGVRSPRRRVARVVSEPQRHDPQLLRRADAVGLLADVRGDDQVNAPDTADEVRHGFVYDVPADGTSDAVPLTQLGRYSHEALCVDPASGIVYLTEDATPSGFYRFVPRRRGDLTAGDACR